MDATTSSQGKAITTFSMPKLLTLDQAKRNVARGPKKNGNENIQTNGSSSPQPPILDAEGSSDGKTRMVKGTLQYRSDDEWSKSTIAHYIFSQSSQVIGC